MLAYTRMMVTNRLPDMLVGKHCQESQDQIRQVPFTSPKLGTAPTSHFSTSTDLTLPGHYAEPLLPTGGRDDRDGGMHKGDGDEATFGDPFQQTGVAYCSQFENNYFTEMCSGSKEASC